MQENRKILKEDYDAVVVGAGPNGLSAAITLRQAGLSVLLIEAKAEIGGGSRSSELTLPGYLHDVCSAIHPMALASPYFKTLALEKYGLHFIQPEFSVAHPFDDGSAAVLYKSVEQTAKSLGEDEAAYRQLIKPMVDHWNGIASNVLGPLRFPAHPLDMMRLGWFGLRSAQQIARRFKTREAKALWSGMAAHTMLPLSAIATSAAAMVLLTTGHLYGWPLVKGGSSKITNALLAYFFSIGGELKTNLEVQSLTQLPVSKVILLDVTPRQLLKIAGNKLTSIYKWQLENYKYGPGVFKIDWALNGPIPFLSESCRKAGTIHLGNT
ncbi:MAG: NAD(P)/FAD-dependent oxidoreductase, partial [Chitinophagaceae bacterium]